MRTSRLKSKPDWVSMSRRNKESKKPANNRLGRALCSSFCVYPLTHGLSSPNDFPKTTPLKRGLPELVVLYRNMTAFLPDKVPRLQIGHEHLRFAVRSPMAITVVLLPPSKSHDIHLHPAAGTCRGPPQAQQSAVKPQPAAYPSLTQRYHRRTFQKHQIASPGGCGMFLPN